MDVLWTLNIYVIWTLILNSKKTSKKDVAKTFIRAPRWTSFERTTKTLNWRLLDVSLFSGYRWIIWSKWEIELCVISKEMVGEAMCLYDGTQWCIVCGEEEGSKNRALGNPSDQLMCFGYLPAPGHPERPTSEIGFKPAKWNPSDIQWWEGGQEDLMIDSVKSGRQIQQNEDWWFGIGFCNSQGFSDR